MTVSVSLDSARHNWRATARSDLTVAMRRAQRHSRLVRFLRLGIPFTLIASAATYGFAIWLNPFGSMAGLPSLSNMVISGTRITMDLPRLAGYTRDGRAYELLATAAAQDLKKPQFIELKEIRGKMELKDGSSVNVVADAGVYNTSTEAMVLQENILVSTSNGGLARLIEAKMDVRKGHIVSEKPVELTSPNGRVDAQQMEISDSGAVIRFRGGVKVEIKGETKQTSQAGQTR